MKGAFLKILAVAIVITLAFFATKPINEKTPVKIGFIGPLSGYAEKTGFEVKASIGSAVKEINDRGGINGKKLELVAEDGKCSYPDAQEAARRLFANEVPIIIGGVCETETMGAASVIGALNEVQPEGKKVLLFAPCSSNSPDSTEDALRFYPFDSQSYGAASADIAYNRLGAKTAAILRCEHAWCSELAVEFKKKFTGLGGSIAFEDIAVLERKSDKEFGRDVEAKIAQLKDSGADLVYFMGGVQHVFVGTAMIKKLNVSGKILATSSSTDPQILQSVDNILSGGAMFAVVPGSETGTEEICASEARDAMASLASFISKTGMEDTALVKTEFFQKAISQRQYVLKTITGGQAIST